MSRTVKNVMIICVSRRDWDFPKHILMETDGKHGERLDDIAKRAFEKYKKSQGNDDALRLVDYTYYGDIEVIE